MMYQQGPPPGAYDNRGAGGAGGGCCKDTRPGESSIEHDVLTQCDRRGYNGCVGMLLLLGHPVLKKSRTS